ncbi:hypothetical protein N1851_032487 [Merluccius polli]|uniref:Ubiquitin-like protease family profile domain-containing protein n=1 Tax=Merluccius polli TaxID=89951 RepID=A0AA47M333_MERPO|nr:hypothetical protein N1851_032487 [Merluccius polli]
MYICDGSLVLMESISQNCCGMSLRELLSMYFDIVTGQGQKEAYHIPILHRCLSHIMKNAKDLCRKHASKHYHLAMHVFGLMTQATTLHELDDIVCSTNVVFSSSCSGEQVDKHFHNLQILLTRAGPPAIDDRRIEEENFVNDVGPTPFKRHFDKNFTRDNRTQGIMEKSQWDLKRVRFQRRSFTRLDDFVHAYRSTHNALLREYKDSLRSIQRHPQDKAKVEKPSTFEKTELHEEEAQLTALWRGTATEVVVSVVPSQIRGNSFLIHHSELQSLKPHQWLTGEVNFDSYKAIVSFVNVADVHWKFLYINAAESSVYLVDPATNSNEQGESDNAAKRFRDYFKMRRISHSNTDWVDIKLKGNVMQHPVQQDGNSCGVVVTMMAKAVMEAFPQPPMMTFGTTKKEMAVQRKHFALQILKASETNCAMCASAKPPGPSFTDWIQCDSCCSEQEALPENSDVEVVREFQLLSVNVSTFSFVADELLLVLQQTSTTHCSSFKRLRKTHSDGCRLWSVAFHL